MLKRAIFIKNRNFIMKIGYTTGVFDLFHIGHLNIIKKAKKYCDYLIVGVTNDKLAYELKNKKPVIPFKERLEIIRSIKYVDDAIEEKKDDKLIAHKKLKFKIIFKGSDWQNSKKWEIYKKDFKHLGVKVKFLKYTKKTSSTLITGVLNKINK
jgi:glycerol-3-phosphate cytidylyltransferase